MMKFFKQRQRIKELQDELANLETLVDAKNASIDRLLNKIERKNEKIETLKTEAQQYQRHNDSLNGENEKLSKQVREQTEADILVTSLKLVGIIKTEEEKPALLDEYNALTERLSAASQQGPLAGLAASQYGWAYGVTSRDPLFGLFGY